MQKLKSARTDLALLGTQKLSGLGSRLQNLHSATKLIVVLRLLRLFLRRRSRSAVLVIGQQIVDVAGYHHIGSYGVIFDCLATGRVVLRHRQNEGRTVRNIDDFLHRPAAEGLVAHYVAAIIVENGGSHDLAGTGGPAIYQYN